MPISRVTTKGVYVTIVKPISTKFVKQNRLRDEDKWTAKVTLNGINLALRTN
jgi:hypothetical protein